MCTTMHIFRLPAPAHTFSFVRKTGWTLPIQCGTWTEQGCWPDFVKENQDKVDRWSHALPKDTHCCTRHQFSKACTCKPLTFNSPSMHVTNTPKVHHLPQSSPLRSHETEMSSWDTQATSSQWLGLLKCVCVFLIYISVLLSSHFCF